MCVSALFGGKASTPPPPPPPPVAAPPPVPTASESTTQPNKNKDGLERMRAGIASTIKTSARGLTGSGSDLVASNTAGKMKLGS